MSGPAKAWLTSIAFWLGLYWYVAGVANQVIHDYGFTNRRVWMPGLLGILCLSVWKVWSDV